MAIQELESGQVKIVSEEDENPDEAAEKSEAMAEDMEEAAEETDAAEEDAK